MSWKKRTDRHCTWKKKKTFGYRCPGKETQGQFGPGKRGDGVTSLLEDRQTDRVQVVGLVLEKEGRVSLVVAERTDVEAGPGKEDTLSL